MDIVKGRYLTSEYLAKNPDWDAGDACWKASRVCRILEKNRIEFQRLCEIGCGSGRVLLHLQSAYPQAELVGYDIAPAAEQFWPQLRQAGIDLKVGDFFELNASRYDLILLLDVLEHVADPHAFLARTRAFSQYLVVHFPLDLSVLSVLRETPLLNVRRKVGHIHYFTKTLALELLHECGYQVLDWQYTGAAFSSPQVGLKGRLARWPRRLFYALHKDIGVRVLGGETLMVLARPA